MLPNVIKYPRTEHLINPGGTATTDDDLVIKDVDAVLSALASDPWRPVIVEEKIDGANLGVRIVDSEIRVQNRSHWITSGEHAQFSMIQPWIQEHRDALFRLLGSETLILYGEWCAAKHSIRYDKLPGSYFIAFDLFDIEVGRFYSRPRFHHALQGSGIPVVPTIGILPTLTNHNTAAATKMSSGLYKHQRKIQESLINSVLGLLDTTSQFRLGGFVEGIILRRDHHDQDWMEDRYKIVRPDFIRGCQDGDWHRRQHIEKQVIDYLFGKRYLEECYVFDPKEQEGRNEHQQAPTTNAISPTSTIACNIAPLPAAAMDETILSSRRRRVPRYILLMGLPASGKSSFATALANAFNGNDNNKRHHNNKSKMPPMVIANQDELGRKDCVKLVSQAAACSNCRVIVDRCNLTVAERFEFWECLHSPPPQTVALVYFAASPSQCMQRAKLRLGHPTMGPGKGRPESVVSQLAKRLELPTSHERHNVFGSVETIHTWNEARALLYKWGVRV